jgi:hypothetical protein
VKLAGIFLIVVGVLGSAFAAHLKGTPLPDILLALSMVGVVGGIVALIVYATGRAPFGGGQ